jgi:hypothetical protein
MLDEIVVSLLRETIMAMSASVLGAFPCLLQNEVLPVVES